MAISGLLFRDVVPPLQMVATGLAGVLTDRAFYANLLVTMWELAIALLLGGGAGLVVGLVLGGSRFARAAFERWVEYLGPTPKIILFPVMILMFGVGLGSKMAMGGGVLLLSPSPSAWPPAVRGVDPMLLRVGQLVPGAHWTRRC